MNADHEARVAELVAALADLAVPRLPSHLADQIDASTLDARGFVDRFGPAAAQLEPDRWRSARLVESNDRAATREAWVRVMLALDGARFCSHLRRGGPQPATARLAVHCTDPTETTPSPRGGGPPSPVAPVPVVAGTFPARHLKRSRARGAR